MSAFWYAWELAILRARGGMGALDEHGAQRAAAATGAPVATLAGTLVVAGTQPGPGGEATGGAEHARIGTHLTQDGAGRGVVDAGDGFQQAALRGVVRQRVVDVPVEVLHAAVEVVVRGDQVGEQEAVGFAQCQLQGITEQLQARANVPAERVQDLPRGADGRRGRRECAGR